MEILTGLKIMFSQIDFQRSRDILSRLSERKEPCQSFCSLAPRPINVRLAIELGAAADSVVPGIVRVTGWYLFPGQVHSMSVMCKTSKITA